MKNRVIESKDYMSMDDVATLLIRLYADYYHSLSGWEDEKAEKYAKAVGIAIRMLID